LDALTRKVRTLLRERFTGLTERFHARQRGGRLIGIVVSRDFARLDDEARMDRLWSVLEEGLAPSELRRVGPIAALSPAEAATLPDYAKPNGSPGPSARSRGRRRARV